MLERARVRTLAWVFLLPALLASAAPTVRWCVPETCATRALPTVACIVALDPSDGGNPIPPADCPLARGGRGPAAGDACAGPAGAGPMAGACAACGPPRAHFVGDPATGRAIAARSPAVPAPPALAVPVASPAALDPPPARPVATPPPRLARPPTRAPGAPPPARAPPSRALA